MTEPDQRHGHDPDSLMEWRKSLGRVLKTIDLRHVVVAELRADYSTQLTVVFGAHEDDESNHDRLFVTMPRQLWLDMGEPGQITVTVQPGDKLNTTGDK